MSVIDEVKDRTDAVELISNYVQLKRTGRSYKGLCPFHAENTPSFVVFPDSGTWHCFGACGEGGDIFTFVMKREGWDFRTALEELAQQAGVELRPPTEKQVVEDQERAKLREILASAATYYHHLLVNAPQAQTAREYLAGRSFQGHTVETFQLGYALDEWHATETFLTGKGYTVPDLIAAGLSIEREDGRVYDRFRGRLMIPIRDVRGRAIGFGARTLPHGGALQDRKDVPKYLNSPQTPLFDKSNTLYGLDAAAKGIRAADRVVVAEGYMDVMQAHQAGFNNVVAQLGTALTEGNLRRLTRYTRRIVLALDPDTAGQAATMRGLDVARQALEPELEPVFDARGLMRLEGRFSADVRVLTLPPGNDPDDLIRADPTRWAVLVDQATPLVEHYIQTLMDGQDLTDPKVKSQLSDAIVPIIREVASPVERAHYAQQLARTLRVDERALLEMVTGTRQRRKRRRDPIRAEPEQHRPGVDLETYCLWGLLHMPPALNEADDVLSQTQLDPLAAGDFVDLENREIFRAWRETAMGDGPPTLEQLATGIADPLQTHLKRLLSMTSQTLQNTRWLVEAQAEPGQDVFKPAPDQARQDLVIALLKLRERNLQRQNAEIRHLLEQADSDDVRAFLYATNEIGSALARLQRRLGDSK